MLSKNDCMTRSEFFTAKLVKGQIKVFRVRSNGKCKTWKTRQEEFKLPVKYGLYEYGYITDKNCDGWFLTEAEAIEAFNKNGTTGTI